MAIYSDYTDEQRNTIDYLINRGKAIHKRIEEIKKLGIFDEDEIIKLDGELESVKKQLKSVLNAKVIFEKHLEMAKAHIEEAEKLSEMWGFTGDGKRKN